MDAIAQQSVEKLFNEPFEPQWQAEQHRNELFITDEYIKASTRKKWDMRAAESQRRILEKLNGKDYGKSNIAKVEKPS